jgi:hypothetical protein
MTTHQSIFAPKPDEDHCAVVDRLPKDLRALVHDYGYSVVVQFYDAGIQKPGQIRHLIAVARLGAREPGNQRPAKISPGVRAINALDIALTEAGAGLHARPVARHLRDLGYVIVPRTGPTREMVDASMATVSAGNLMVSKPEKHQRRLQAAINAFDAEMWGRS